MKTTFVKGYTRTTGGKKEDPFQSFIDARRARFYGRSRVWIPESEVREKVSLIWKFMRWLGWHE